MTTPKFSEEEALTLLEKREDCTHSDTENGFCTECNLHIPTHFGTAAMKVEWEKE
jgi:hypothetical protein